MMSTMRNDNNSIDDADETWRLLMAVLLEADGGKSEEMSSFRWQHTPTKNGDC